MDPAIAFFFIFYFFVASTVLMNVLIAVLLGNLCVMCGGVCVCVCVCVLCVCVIHATAEIQGWIER